MNRPLLVVAHLVVLVSLSAARSARAGEKDPVAAEALFRSAKEAMSKSDLQSACARFAESQRLDPAPGTLLNLAECEEKNGRLASASAHLVEALEMLPSDDFRAAYAQKQVAALKGRVPTVTLTLAPSSAGARVVRDAVELREAALGVPLPLDPGPYVFVVSAEGRAGTRREVRVREGDHLSLTLDAGPSTALAPPVDLPERGARAGSRGGRTALTVGAFALGAAGVVTGVVTGLLTASAASTLKEHCSGRVCDPDGMDAAARGTTFEIVSPVAFALGALGAGLGTYLVLTSPPARKTGALSVGPRVSSREGGVFFSGSF